MDALAKLWVLADKLLIPSLQNQVIHKIDAIAAHSSEVYTKPMNYVYSNTSANTPLRRLFVLYCTRELGTEEYSVCADDLPKEMLDDVATLFSMNIGDDGDRNLYKAQRKANYDVLE
jgi:hypothetical protein